MSNYAERFNFSKRGGNDPDLENLFWALFEITSEVSRHGYKSFDTENYLKSSAGGKKVRDTLEFYGEKLGYPIPFLGRFR